MILSFETDNRQVWANSVDADQTVPSGTIWSGLTLFVIPSAFLDTLLYGKFELYLFLWVSKFYRFLWRWQSKGKWAISWQNQQNDCVPSEDSDQPGHPPSLIRVFAVHSMGCPGWSESSLGAHILLVLSWGGSNQLPLHYYIPLT